MFYRLCHMSLAFISGPKPVCNRMLMTEKKAEKRGPPVDHFQEPSSGCLAIAGQPDFIVRMPICETGKNPLVCAASWYCANHNLYPNCKIEYGGKLSFGIATAVLNNRIIAGALKERLPLPFAE